LTEGNHEVTKTTKDARSLQASRPQDLKTSRPQDPKTQDPKESPP
jgi:hypothetical protein